MCALSMGWHLAYVFGARSDLAKPGISGISKIKHVDQKECPVGDQKDKINSYVLILQSMALLSWSPSHVLHWT